MFYIQLNLRLAHILMAILTGIILELAIFGLHFLIWSLYWSGHGRSKTYPVNTDYRRPFPYLHIWYSK